MKKLFSLCFVIASNLCSAQYTVLLNFNGTNGDVPRGSLTLTRNLLFGMTDGDNIFSIDTNGSGFDDLFNFNGTNGERPTASLLLSGGIFYGMTPAGGTYGDGNIFSIDTNGNNIKDIFDFNGTNGGSPYGDLILSGKVLYGMTGFGLPPNTDGNIFSIDTDGSNFNILLEFNGSNGKEPDGKLTL